jgi:hypothetical protein
MCEPVMLTKTGKTVVEHQRLTIDNFLELKAIAPEMPFIPVLQGWEMDDYMRHVEMWSRVGVDLSREPTVGIGSVCRRQNTDEIGTIVSSVAALGISLHGFGVKTLGLRSYAKHLKSADSMAWSYNARMNPPMEGCDHKNCANCPRWALRWRNALVARLPSDERSRHVQLARLSALRRRR